MAGVRLAVLAAALLATACGAGSTGPASSTTTSTTTAAPTTTSTTSTTTTEEPASIEPLGRLRPLDEFEIALANTDVPSATPLYIARDPDDGSLPTWAVVGTVERIDGVAMAVGRIPEGILWQLDSGEFGEASASLMSAGRYELLTLHRALGPIEIIEDGYPTERGEPSVTPGPLNADFAILRADGLGPVDFGLSTEPAVELLRAEFGEPAEDQVFDGCLSYRALRWDNGITARFDESFAEYTFSVWDVPADPSADNDDVWPPPRMERTPFSTLSGLRLGDTVEELPPTVRYGGEYDAVFGAQIWFEDSYLGGRLSGDVSDRETFVVTIEAGREGTPARMVC